VPSLGGRISSEFDLPAAVVLILLLAKFGLPSCTEDHQLSTKTPTTSPVRLHLDEPLSCHYS